jgi:hypothetical protein
MFRKVLSVFLYLLLVTPDLRAALTSDTVWEVRQAGADTNGGCFDTGASGTDRSQQDAAQIAYTDLIVGANPDNENLTSAATPFTAAEVGNCIRVNSGAGCNVGYFVVLSVAANVATMDRDVGTAASVCSGNLGGAVGGTGAWDFCGSVVAGNTIHIKADATYTHTATICAITIDGTALLPVKWVGYQTTRGDDTGTRPILTSATNSITLITVVGADYQQIRNIKFTHTASTRGTGIAFNTTVSASPLLDNLWFDGLSFGIDMNSASPTFSYLTNTFFENTTNNAVRIAGNNIYHISNVVVRNAGNGAGSVAGLWYTNGTGTLIFDNVVVSGSSGHGFHFSATTSATKAKFTGVVSEGNTGDGIRVDATTGIPVIWLDRTIMYGNSGWGINYATVSSYVPDAITLINRTNAYGSNTSGARNNLSAGVGDVTLTADPFTSGGSGKDWDLNATAGGGAALKSVGFPGAVGATGSTSTTGFPDIGVSRHEDPAGGGSTILIPPVVSY